MEDIDMAFGHMMAGPSSAASVPPSTTTASFAGTGSHGTPSQYTASYASPPSRTPAFVSSDASATGLYTMPSSYRSPMPPPPGPLPSSAATYIPAEAMDGMMSMAAVNAIDSDVIQQEVRLGIATLANLAQDVTTDRVDTFRSADTISTILSGMWRFERDEMVQENGVQFLHYLTHPASHSHLRALIMSLGGISTVLRAMHLFPTTLSLQQTCCTFISKMVTHDPVALDSIITLQGMDLVVLAMRMHRLEERIQEAACQALESMMRLGEGLEMDIVSGGGMEAILHAMWQFEGNSLVQQNGCSSMGLLCAQDDGNKRLALEAGVIETVLGAMQRHPQNNEIQRAGCVALYNISNNYGAALRRCLEENAVSVVRQASHHDEESANRLLRSLRIQRYRSRVF
uniref:LRRK2 ARM repeat domain-containing protein n=1 Tax=Entomoneis paludosa TaxID=265537 RepID=A0A7S2VEZ6_9STRA